MSAAEDIKKEETAPAFHSVHDGIEEHDNHLPRWWLLTLFGAIVFSVGYWFYYQHLEGPGQLKELAADEKALADLREKAAGANLTDDSLLALSKDAAAVGKGAETFRTACAACHGEKGEGKIGPNLTDPFWIHGGKPTQIYKTVMSGVPEKGMMAWGSVLGAGKVKEVVGFVETLRNTNVPGKEPQGAKE